MQQVCRRNEVVQDSKQRQQCDAEIVKDDDALAAKTLDMVAKGFLKVPFLPRKSIRSGFH